MKHYTVILNVVVSVRITRIQADNADEAARTALNVVTGEQLSHLFERQIDERVDTFYAEDIPAIMIDEFKGVPAEGDEPAATHWRRVDIPSDDMDVFAAIEDVLRIYKEGATNAFASDDLASKMKALEVAYDALPPHRVFVAAHTTPTDETTGEQS